MNKLSEAELWSLYQSDPRQLAEKARAAGWTQSAEDQTVWKNICAKRWSTKLPGDKVDQSNWLIPLTENKEVDWRRYYILRDLYTALEQDLWTVMEKQNARKAKAGSSRGGRGGRGRGGKARGGAKAAEAPKPVNKTETEMTPKNVGTMWETIHASMIDITSGKAAPANLEKFLQNFADFSLDFLKVLVVQGNLTDNADIEKNNQKLVASVFIIWEDLIGEPDTKVVTFFKNYNDKYVVNLTDLLALCLKNSKRSKMIVHLLLDNVVNIWESLAQFAVAESMGADFGDEEDEEDEEDDEEEPAPKAKAHAHEHVHGENCNHDHDDIDDICPVSDETLLTMLKALQDLLINWPTDQWNGDFNKVGDVDAPRPNQEFTEYVDKLSMVVGGTSCFNAVLKLVDQPLTDPNADFKAKHAALFMLAVTCEASVVIYKTSDELMEKVLKTYIMPQLSHSHSDVVHAAVHTLSLMMHDLGPELQNKYHATILPALEAFLLDGTKKRNQLVAVASLNNFCEKVDNPELFAPYLKKLFEGILPLINSDDKHIRERAFYTADALAGASQEHFLPYREATLQAISKLLTTEDTEELGQVLETLCRIASYKVDDEAKKTVKAALDVAIKKFEAIRKEVESKQPPKPAAPTGAFNFGTASTGAAPAFNFGAATTGAQPNPNFTFNFGGSQPAAQPAGDKPFVFNFSDLPSLEENNDKKEKSPEEWLNTVCVMTAGLAAKVLGQDFAPYMDFYMKTIVSIIENVEDVPDDDIDPFGEDDDDDDMGGMKSAGGAMGGINPAAMNQTLFLQLNNKAKAVKALGLFAENLGPLFSPHITVAIEKASNMLNYAHLEKVREKAATSLVSLYKAASGSDKDKSKCFSDIVHTLINSVGEDPSLETIDAKLEALADLINLGQLNANQVNKLFELMSTVLEIVDQVAAEAGDHGEEMMDDEDDDEDGPGGIEEADVVVGDLISIVEAIAKNNKDLFIKAFTPNLWVYQRMVEIAGLVKKKGAKTAVPAFKEAFGPWFMCCMVDAIAENIGEESFALLEKFLPVVTKYIQADEADVAQAAAFGVGVYAQAYKAKYAPFVKDALKGLKELIHGEKSQDEEFAPVIDNAISSLGKLCLYIPESVELTKLADEFMKLLPITKDHEEAVVCHGVLIELVAKHPELDRVQLLRIFGGLLRDEQLTNEATRKAVENKLNEWKSDAASLKADIAKVTDEQAQEALNKHFSF